MVYIGGEDQTLQVRPNLSFWTIYNSFQLMKCFDDFALSSRTDHRFPLGGFPTHWSSISASLQIGASRTHYYVSCSPLATMSNHPQYVIEGRGAKMVGSQNLNITHSLLLGFFHKLAPWLRIAMEYLIILLPTNQLQDWYSVWKDKFHNILVRTLSNLWIPSFN